MSSSFDWNRISERGGRRRKRGARYSNVKGNTFCNQEKSRVWSNALGSRLEQNPTGALFNPIRGVRSRLSGQIHEPSHKKRRRKRLNYSLKLDQLPAKTFHTGLRGLIESDPSMITLDREKPEQVEKPKRVFKHLDAQLKVMRQQIPMKTQCERMAERPGDFRSLSVIPSCEEISSNERPFLRPCLMNGGYRDSQHYLDVLFRLFKEDFVRPLRQAVNLFPNSPELTDIWVYQNVTVRGTKIKGSNFLYILNLSERKFFSLDSKQLMFGNVLCISPDNFKTMLVATVACRDNLSLNLLGVKVETEPFALDIDKNYSIIESKSYFVAYYHTLKALKEFDVVPFENYIVRVCESHSPPGYITDTTMFNLHSKGKKSLRLLSPINEWPTAFNLMVDEPQFRALHAALTRQVAIIQGPPGTGKTFLGLKVVEILLRNREVWNEKFCSRPILVVCYTNHALDQFLEGIRDFTRQIVRVGSRSKSEFLKEFQIKNYIRNHNSNFKRILNKLRTLKSCIANLTEMTKKVKIIRQLLPIHSLPIEKFLFDAVDNDMRLRKNSQLSPLKDDTSNEMEYIAAHSPEFVELVRKDQKIGERLDLEEGEIIDEPSGLEGETIDDPTYEGVNHRSNCLPDVLEYTHNLKNTESCRENLKGDVNFDSTVCSNVNGLFDEVASIYERDEEEYPRLLDDMEEPLEQLEIESSSGWIKFEISEDDIKERLRTERNPDIKLKLQQELRFIRALSKLHVNENYPIRIEAGDNIWNLSFEKRWRLYTLWLNQVEAHILKEKLEKVKEYRRVHRSLDECKEHEYLTIMKDAHVVGMTTTAAAQYCRVLHDLGPPIVLVEEAAKIFEAHVVTSLSSSCKHLIMIGDHQQLRPKPNVFELAKNFHLDTSLFERLINNGIKYEVLEHQHRMKPSFSKLLVPAIYPNLKDHPSVLNRPLIRGVAKDLFFVDHHVFEDKKRDELESFQNRHEAEFAMGLCRYLLLQGYESSDISIITPYSGQFRLLEMMQLESRFNCSGVRISTLDSYQGKESDIIILSLVRSNKDERIGFMRADNRVCVALSRAKFGMYIIGNMTQMARESPLWAKIKGKLMSDCEIGSELKLTCDKHQEEILVSCFEDFQSKSPNGGCRNICSSSYKNCVHTCQDICHPSYYDHSLVECMQPCVEVCPFGHPCPLVCSRSCPSCTVRVEKELPCGHSHQIPCYVPPEDYKCTTIVSKPQPLCNHSVSVPCHRTEFTCREKCLVRLDCGHQCRRTCHQGDDPEHEDYECRQPCEKKTPCGHTVKGVERSLPLDQIECSFPCAKIRQCGHKCEKKCKEKCGQCIKKVEKNALGCGRKGKVLVIGNNWVKRLSKCYIRKQAPIPTDFDFGPNWDLNKIINRLPEVMKPSHSYLVVFGLLLEGFEEVEFGPKHKVMRPRQSFSPTETLRKIEELLKVARSFNPNIVLYIELPPVVSLSWYNKNVLRSAPLAIQEQYAADRQYSAKVLLDESLKSHNEMCDLRGSFSQLRIMVLSVMSIPPYSKKITNYNAPRKPVFLSDGVYPTTACAKKVLRNLYTFIRHQRQKTKRRENPSLYNGELSAHNQFISEEKTNNGKGNENKHNKEISFSSVKVEPGCSVEEPTSNVSTDFVPSSQQIEPEIDRVVAFIRGIASGSGSQNMTEAKARQALLKYLVSCPSKP